MQYYETIVDLSTGTVTQREYTAEEIAEIKAAEAEAELQAAEAAAKAAARQAVLDKLGLTAEDIAALGL
jgi:hypothetical protein